MHGYPFSNLTGFQCDILLAVDLLSKDYRITKQDEAVLTKAIARLLFQIAAETKRRDHADFLALLAHLFDPDPEFRADRLIDYPEKFIRAARRRIKLVMTTKGHPKDRHVDDEDIPRTARGTPKAEAIAQRFGVGLRQAYRIKASKKRRRKAP
jgi:hypothetical protein